MRIRWLREIRGTSKKASSSNSNEEETPRKIEMAFLLSRRRDTENDRNVVSKKVQAMTLFYEEETPRIIRRDK
jgi:hypothetical protein